MAAPCVEHLVVDAGGFLKNVPLHQIGHCIYTLPDVVDEIRDKATRERLQFLPFDIIFRQPTTDCIKFVTEFSKKTGDYGSLSAIDLKVLALTYQLESEHVGTDHIRIEPNREQVKLVSTTRHPDNPAEIAGFYLRDTQKTGSRQTSESSAVQETVSLESGQSNGGAQKTGPRGVEESQKNEIGDKTDAASGNSTDIKHGNLDGVEEGMNEMKIEEDVTGPVAEEGEALEDDWTDEGESEDGDGGWITPGNIQAVKQRMGVAGQERGCVEVGCLTTDFSIQNVLIQIGLNVVSIDGLMIKHAKSYVLRCFACGKVTTCMTREFCGNCGNATLRRITMAVNASGSVQYFLSRRKPISTRGMKHNLPAPKGGKHSNNPIVCEDQPMPQQRASRKSQARVNVLDPDYVAGSSPFLVHDVGSRAAQLGIRRGRRKGRKGEAWRT